eukprot:TRINITY_DN48242_c0_g1_i1.p1 TRINITY_DN48242_c0_g1~~TRINITY_DN48242_c0_g1_i1.p1  ORF type:complete len:572 (-),score=42.85 TRINITY_DN48242_c0_g1_i1:156-1727(-)
MDSSKTAKIVALGDGDSTHTNWDFEELGREPPMRHGRPINWHTRLKMKRQKDRAAAEIALREGNVETTNQPTHRIDSTQVTTTDNDDKPTEPTQETEKGNSTPLCNWLGWGRWSPCDKACGSGSHKRVRRRGYHADPECLAYDTQVRTCNLDPCPQPAPELTATVTLGPFAVPAKRALSFKNFKMHWPKELPHGKGQVIYMKGIKNLQVTGYVEEGVVSNTKFFTGGKKNWLEYGSMSNLQLYDFSPFMFLGTLHEKTDWELEGDYRLGVSPYLWNNAATKVDMYNPTTINATLQISFDLIWGPEFAAMKQVELFPLDFSYTPKIEDKKTPSDSTVIYYSTFVAHGIDEQAKIVGSHFRAVQGVVSRSVTWSLDVGQPTNQQTLICNSTASYDTNSVWTCADDVMHCNIPMLQCTETDRVVEPWTQPVTNAACDVKTHKVITTDSTFHVATEFSMGCGWPEGGPKTIQEHGALFLWNWKTGKQPDLVLGMATPGNNQQGEMTHTDITATLPSNAISREEQLLT